MDTDPIDVWRGLYGSRDFRAVTAAGSVLCEHLERARAAWRAREVQHRDELEQLQRDLDAANSALELHDCGDDLDGALLDVILEWHDRTHSIAWPVCPHVVCRFVVLAGVESTAQFLHQVPA